VFLMVVVVRTVWMVRFFTLVTPALPRAPSVAAVWTGREGAVVPGTAV